MLVSDHSSMQAKVTPNLADQNRRRATRKLGRACVELIIHTSTYSAAMFGSAGASSCIGHLACYSLLCAYVRKTSVVRKFCNFSYVATISSVCKNCLKYVQPTMIVLRYYE